MHTLLIHLSDIHIKGTADRVLGRVEAIADAAASVDSSIDLCVTVITGDVANTGNSAEYLAASQLVSRLRRRLLARLQLSDAAVQVVILPGNHDCDFSGDQSVRTLVRAGTLKDIGAITPELISVMTAPQQNFREFVAALRTSGDSLGAASETNLVTQYLVGTGDHQVVINCYNTAWCSEREESAGTLAFPPTAAAPSVDNPRAIVISAFHHPYQWLQPNNARTFRGIVEENSDLVITGHEHSATNRRTVTSTGESFTHVEGAALQESDTGRSGFNVFVIDVPARRHRFVEFTFGAGQYIPAVQDQSELPAWAEMPLSKIRARGALLFTAEYLTFLDDVALQLSPRVGEVATLSDVFVFPDVREMSPASERQGQLIVGHKVVDHLRQMDKVMLTGEDTCGKSALAKMLCKSFHSSGDVPILLRAQSSVANADQLRKAVRSEIVRQYGTHSLPHYEQLDKARKVVVFDDFDRCAASTSNRRKVIAELEKVFGRIVLIANDLTIDVGDLLDPQDNQIPRLRIQPFGYVHRNELIEKWLARSPDDDEALLARRAVEITRTINEVVARGYVPALPVYLLAILQASDGSIAVDTKISTHGYYYELLIRAELLRGANHKETDVLTAFLAFLGYALLVEGKDEVSVARFNDIYRQYQQRHDVATSVETVMTELCKRKMLSKSNDSIAFKYKYVLYYFTASFLREHLDDMEVRSHIQTLVANTHRRRSADILLFLVHLTKNVFVVNTLLKAAGGHYAGISKVTRFDEVTLPVSVREAVEKVAYEERGAREARGDVAAKRDRVDEERSLSPERADDWVTEFEPIRRIVSALHTMQVLGQVLKNYPGHLEAETKLSLAVETYGIGCRVWRAVFESLVENKEDVARQLVNALGGLEGDLSADGLSDRVQSAIKALVFMCGLGVVKRIGDAIGSPELGLTYEKLVAAEEDSEAVNVVGLSIQLEHNGVIPEAEIKRVYSATKHSPLGLWIVQQLTLNHFHLFQVPAATKQRICAVIDVKYTSALGTAGRPKLLGPKGG